MSPRRELILFALVLGGLLAGFFHASLFGGKVLSPGDVVYTTVSFAEGKGPDYEPANRLLMDPVLQFQPWLEFSRSEVRAGRLPLWNPFVGCGAPHLANGQSAVFDPFQPIAYLGRLPEALAWMAWARLLVAGLGMFCLARSWGFSPMGRWLSGMSYPLCGFLVVWLLYPVTNVAVWMPWLFLATDRALDGPRLRGVPGLALVAGFVMLGGHVQTSAHVLLAAGLYAVWRVVRIWRADRSEVREPRFETFDTSPTLESRISDRESGTPTRPALLRWSFGIALGLALAAIEILPLAAYLSRSPVWEDRRAERLPILAVSRPRVLDAMTTAFPYLFGSQRRGHPNLARALGVHNLNESAGGFAGLATLVLLAPAAWRMRKAQPRVVFLVGLGAFGALGAFGVSPVTNLLRAVPVLDVADNRRLTLWVAFSLCLLGGIGIEAIGRTSGRRDVYTTRALIVGSVLMAVAAGGVMAMAPRIQAKAIAHYAIAAKETPGADPSVYRERAERQARNATRFLPRYALLAAGHLALLAALSVSLRRRGRTPASRAALASLVIIDLLAFGYDLNPAISRSDDRPESDVVAYLRRECPPPARILGIGAELPPNVLMRYGLADARNYDSVESSRSLDWFEPLYEPEPGRASRSSRRTIRWDGVARSLDRLRLAGVTAIVGATAPPEGVYGRVDRIGSVWIARLESRSPAIFRPFPREIRIDLDGQRGQVRWVAETFDPGWSAEIDGEDVPAVPHLGTFLGAHAPPGARRLVFRYDPPEVRVALTVSLAAFALLVLVTIAARTPGKNAVRGLDGPDGPR